jgi:branched-subunit amino acid ABC-type transport system permease component
MEEVLAFAIVILGGWRLIYWALVAGLLVTVRAQLAVMVVCLCIGRSCRPDTDGHIRAFLGRAAAVSPGQAYARVQGPPL